MGEQPASSEQPDGTLESTTSVVDLRRDVSALRELMGAAEREAEQARGRAQEIEAYAEEAKQAKEELDAIRASAAQLQEKLQNQNTRAEESLRTIDSNATRAQELVGTATTNAATIGELKSKSESYTAAAKGLADIAAQTQERIKGYEDDLASFNEKAEELGKKIESLLPGATSVGLAEAFQRRKERFKLPQRMWSGGFVLSVLGILSLFVWQFGVFSSVTPAQPSYELFLLAVLQRLPFAGPLIWLAIHCARQAALAKRVEEEYAFKEAVSRSFEGYRREMFEIGDSLPAESVVRQLCQNTLSAIARPPGRIYDRTRIDVTPLSVLSDELQKIAKTTSDKNAASALGTIIQKLLA